STFNGTEKDIIHAIAGNPFRIRSWSMIGSTLYITIKKDNILILQMSMGIGHDRNSTVQKGRMIPIYNQATQELSVLFQNISKEDGGIYEMKESFYRTDIGNEAISDEPEVDTYDIRYDTWLLEIYVLDPSDIRHTYVGENISMESKRSIPHSTLYNYDKLGAFLTGSPCSVLTDSFLFERLRCANDHSGSMYNITIENVSQRDAGLYKITAGDKETEIYLFDIKDSPICAVVGDNLTFGWFYNQQGIQRTLRVIHPNQGLMMLLHQTNSLKIKNIFHHRIQYSGDILQSYMSFTLLNVNLSDAGLYTIETLHGNTIPGSKELIVNGACTTGGFIQTTFHDVQKKKSASELEVVTVQPMEGQCSPIYIFAPVFTVAVVVSITIIAMTRCRIWIQRRNSNHLVADKRLEGWVSSLTISNDLRHQPDSSIRSVSGAVDTTLYNHGVSCIVDHTGLNTMNDGVYSLAKAAAGLEYAYNDIVEGIGTRQDSHNIQPFHGKDKQLMMVYWIPVHLLVPWDQQQDT
ncbi:hypothetical protein ACJMK2_031734, partial [Sinanodonta woodiana]